MKPHRTDLLSLVFAVVFLAIFGWWVFAQVVNVDVPAPGWWVAFALILLGLLGLIGAIRSTRNASMAQRSAVPAVDPVPPDDLAVSDPEPTADLGDPVSAPPRGQSRD
jgi:TRAP-type C4-dicarboxylate transport system permease small subunit